MRAGEAGGGGAVIEATGFSNDDNEAEALPTAQRIVVKTFIKPGARGAAIRREIEEGLWRLSLLYPIPEAQIREVHDGADRANAWKQFYKPLRIGRARSSSNPHGKHGGKARRPCDTPRSGMAFGTGMHPTMVPLHCRT